MTMPRAGSEPGDVLFEREGHRASMLALLLERVARHDVAAFATLYRETELVLSRVAWKILRRREWTEEVLQESYVKVWRFAGSYDSARALALTWMVSIVRNQALDQLRRNATFEHEAGIARHAVGQLGDEAADESGEGADAAVAVDVKRALACLAHLAPAQRQAISLAYLRECSHSQVAGRLGMPLGTVKARIRSGLVNLKQLIEAPVA